MNRKANFIIVGADHRRGAQLVIKDVGPWDQHPTVTNDAENVVRSLAAQGHLPEGRRLFYYDSDGRLDEILVKDGQFVGFAPGPDVLDEAGENEKKGS
jgi:multidrug efflux pump subunit AcrA (membrane-fusion protein)